MSQKRKKKLKVKKKFIVFFVAFILLCATLFVISLVFLPPKMKDSEVTVTIPSGSGMKGIADILDDKGVLKSKTMFLVYTKLRNKTNIYAATYKLNKNMNLIELVDTLLKGGKNGEEVSITFKEGINMRGVADLISKKTTNSYDEVMAKVNDKEFLDKMIGKYWFLTNDIKNTKIYYALEGYLFPDTYIFTTDQSVEDIFIKMLDNTDKVLSKYKSEISNSKYSVHKLITLASITQSEGYNETDFKNIASVFYNRMKTDMPLGSCVTSYYGVKKDMTDPLTEKDIDAKNAYNTRGDNPTLFPVGAISNPGKEALVAVIKPVSTNYYYFVSDSNNKLYFTKTYSEHEAMIANLKNKGLWLEW